MSDTRDSIDELSDVKFVLFGLQLTVVGTLGGELLALVVLGLGVSLVALVRP